MKNKLIPKSEIKPMPRTEPLELPGFCKFLLDRAIYKMKRDENEEE